jgi:hypothetical protein
MSAGRKPNPKPVAPENAWYTVLAKALNVYAFTSSNLTHQETPKTIWRQNDLALPTTPNANSSKRAAG